MAKYTAHTKLMIGGKDLSAWALKIDLPRVPGDVQTATVSLAVERLEIDPEGTLVIHIAEEA